jgi:predicted permease
MSYGPLSGRSSSGNFSLQGYTPEAGREMDMYIVNAGPGFFKTMGMPLLLGRSIGPRDTPASPLVAVVSQEFVREYLPGQNPIGRRFCKGAPFRDPAVEIVGVVADSKYYDPRANAKPMAYFAAWQVGGPAGYIGELAIRTAHDASGAAAAVRRALLAIDDKLPVENITTMHERVAKSVRQERLTSRFCGFFGLLSLLLASIGLYGTMAYAVARRTGEIGVRMALGARRADVLWMVMQESLLLVVLGLACGLPLALAGTRWIKSFLFGITPLDPLGIGAAAILLVVTSALAGYLPARRATQVDPLTALRHE